MNCRVGKLFEIIQLYLEKLCNEEETVNLFKLLSLDLSPCLQKKIIKIYISYFQNDKIPTNTKKNFLDNLLKNNFLEISEYVLSISLLDVRIEILKLFYILTNNKDLSEVYINYLNNMKGKDGLKNMDNFIGDNLLPDQIFVEINEKKEKLVNYFNKDMYDKDLESLWVILSQWLTVKTNSKKNTNVKSYSSLTVSNTILEYCFLFVSRAPEKYVDLFIATIFSFFKDETITNNFFTISHSFLYHYTTILYFFIINLNHRNITIF